MTGPRVVVVGGGLAGLAAALACADGGARVTLLEARPRLGGATYSFRREGLWVDNGQHVFLRCCTAYRGLLARVGAEARTVLQRRLSIPILSPGAGVAWLRRNGLPAPLHLAPSLARYRLLSVRERLRLVPAAWAMARVDLADPSLDARTFAEWLAERGQSAAAVDALWGLLALPALNLPPSEASLALAAKVFKTGLLEDRGAADIGYPRVPLSEVHAEPAARALRAAGAEVGLRARVSRIAIGDGGIPAVEVEGSRLEADAVIVAVPHDQAATLLPAQAGVDPDRLLRLGTSPIVNVHVVYDRKVTDLPFAAGYRSPVQWVFDRTEPSGLSGGQYLAVSLSAAGGYAERRVEDLRREFLPALEALFPRARAARVTAFFVTREQAATFRQAPGTGALRPGVRTLVPRLFLAGAWTDTGWPATMEGAVRSGLAAAREALLSLGRTRRLPEVVAA